LPNQQGLAVVVKQQTTVCETKTRTRATNEHKKAGTCRVHPSSHFAQRVGQKRLVLKVRDGAVEQFVHAIAQSVVIPNPVQRRQIQRVNFNPAIWDHSAHHN
jgi:hypothetical protein